MSPGQSNWFKWFCPRCREMVPKGHAHTPSQGQSALTAMIRQYGCCGCNSWYLKYQCESCKKFICGKNGSHSVRLTKNGKEAANGPRKFCVDCGIKARKAT